MHKESFHAHIVLAGIALLGFIRSLKSHERGRRCTYQSTMTWEEMFSPFFAITVVDKSVDRSKALVPVGTGAGGGDCSERCSHGVRENCARLFFWPAYPLSARDI